MQNGHFWLRCSHSSMQAQQQLCPQGAIVTGSHLPKRDETRASVHDARGQGWSRSAGAAHMTSRHTGQVIRSSSITPPCAADAAADVAGTAGASNASAVITLCGRPSAVPRSSWRVQLARPATYSHCRQTGAARRGVPAVFVRDYQ